MRGRSVLIASLQLHKNSGSARTVFEQIKYFKENNYKVFVASLTLNKRAVAELGVTPYRLLPWVKRTGLKRRNWFNFQVSILKWMIRPDVIIGHGDILEQDILTLHNSVFLANELIYKQKLSKDNEMAIIHGNILNSGKFQFVIANSRMMKEDLIKRFGISSDKIEVIYPMLDSNVFYRKSDEERAEFRRKFNLPNKIVVALVTSGNFKKRGLDRFIGAIKSLPDHIREMADFRVVGKDRVSTDYHYLTFDGEMEDIQNYYNAIDIFVLPAYIEEFGRVVIEAMGCGLPVITTSTVGASEILVDEGRRFILSPFTTDSFSSALKDLILSKELREDIGRVNSRAVSFSLEQQRSKLNVILNKMENIY